MHRSAKYTLDSLINLIDCMHALPCKINTKVAFLCSKCTCRAVYSIILQHIYLAELSDCFLCCREPFFDSLKDYKYINYGKTYQFSDGNRYTIALYLLHLQMWANFTLIFVVLLVNNVKMCTDKWTGISYHIISYHQYCYQCLQKMHTHPSTQLQHVEFIKNLFQC